MSKGSLQVSCLAVAAILSLLPGGLQAGSHRERSGTLVWDGVKRSYLLHTPTAGHGPFPLVIALHGGGGTAEGMVRLTLGNFDSLADREGFVVVYPEGLKSRWNDGRDEDFSQTDDVGFISALIDELARSAGIDRARVYATGISNGAQMCMRLIRDLPEKIAAVAPVAYAMSERSSRLPLPARPLSVLVMTGTEDPLVPWGGGETPGLLGRRMLGRVLSVSETVRVLAAHNGCPGPPVVSREPVRDGGGGTRVRKEVYPCGKEEVVLYAIEGGGHTWPGGLRYLPEWIVGKTSREINACEVIWEFFRTHRRE